MAANGRDLVHGTTGIGETGQRRFAQTVEATLGRKIRFVTPFPKLVTESIWVVAFAGLRGQQCQVPDRRRVDDGREVGQHRDHQCDASRVCGFSGLDGQHAVAGMC